MTGAADQASSRRRGGAWAAAIVGSVIALAGLAFVVRMLAANWPEVEATLGSADYRWLVVAFLAGLGGMTWIGTGWHLALSQIGESRPLVPVLRWYFPGQLGKYIPGGLWPIVGRSELAVRAGVDRPAAYASVGLSLAVTYLAAAMLAAVTLPWGIGPLIESDVPWVLLLLPVGIAVLHPKVLRRVVILGESVLGRAIEVRVPSWAATVRLIAWHLPAWLLIAVATWCVARSFVPAAPLLPVIFATAVSWFAGFIVIGVPGGIGVREAAFVSILSIALPVGLASVVALVARVLFVLVDVAGAALAVGSRVRDSHVVTDV